MAVNYTFTAITLDQMPAQYPPPPPTPSGAPVGDTFQHASPDGNYLIGSDPKLTTVSSDWILGHDGTYTPIFSTANDVAGFYNEPVAVSNSGEVVGRAFVNGAYQSFSEIGGVISAIVAPGSVAQQWAGFGGSAGGAPPLNSTDVEAVNSSGEVGGLYADADNKGHGFTEQNGVYSSVAMPGASGAGVSSVMDDGTIYGNWVDAAGKLNYFKATPNSAPANNFVVADQTTGTSTQEAGSAYTGPVAGLTNECIKITPDNVNITAITPNSFIHTGSGEDAIDVSKAGGTNVLDGGTGSNFLVGGSGQDTFFADARGSTADIWSTIVGFHPGDSATIWGLTKDDFQLSTADNRGAAGYTGLTFEASRAGTNVSVTLKGFTRDNLASGLLQVSYGRSPDTAGLAGSNYMMITEH